MCCINSYRKDKISKRILLLDWVVEVMIKDQPQHLPCQNKVVWTPVPLPSPVGCFLSQCPLSFPTGSAQALPSGRRQSVQLLRWRECMPQALRRSV